MTSTTSVGTVLLFGLGCVAGGVIGYLVARWFVRRLEDRQTNVRRFTVKWVRLWTNLLLAGAAMGSVLSFAVVPSNAVQGAVLLVLIVCTFITLGVQQRTTEADQMLGVWTERDYVVGSLVEASTSDDDFHAWVAKYLLRLRDEAAKDGVDFTTRLNPS